MILCDSIQSKYNIMKHKKISQIVALLGLFPAVAVSQVYETAQMVTFTLTETESAPALVARDSVGVPILGDDGKTFMRYENDFSTTRGTISTTTSEYGSKMLVWKITNKQILEALQEAGVITNIAGYSISLYQSSGNESTEGGFAFHLVKAGSPAINISQNLFISAEGASAETETERSIVTANSATDTSTEKYTNTSNGKTLVELRFTTANVNVTLKGVAVYSDSYRIVKQGTQQFGLIVPGAASINSIVGESIPVVVSPGMGSAEEEDPSLLEGRISMGAAMVLPRATPTPVQ